MEPIPAPPGTLSFDEEVYRAIAERVIAGLPAVRLARPRGIIRRLRRAEGVGVSIGTERVDIRTPVVVRTAGDVRSACAEVQHSVTVAVWKMTGARQVAVHVSVRGIE
jgi:uncharacterized alkaline shock family protein YloU